ncbi:MAG: outer membrane protein assembly factor BamD [Candidatus Marinimicrobia bacterium]|nr:outer membrane protein assembly factor BamD [Candidatus Neomarinimicrobiota bacterium]
MTNRVTRNIYSIALVLFIGVSLQFCASQKEDLKAGDIAATFQSGMTYLEKENFIKAEETFTFIVYNDPAGAYADDAQFYLAETYYLREEYLLAISEYDRLIHRMKNSSFVEDAFWRKTEAYCELSPDFRLERDMTDKALKYLYDFMEIYPNSSYRPDAEALVLEMRGKLARKLIESAKLYDTLREYESAVFYYDSIIEQYSDTKLYAAARLGKAGDMVALERWDEARELMNSIAIDGRQDLNQKETLRLRTLGKKVLEVTSSSGN